VALPAPAPAALPAIGLEAVPAVGRAPLEPLVGTADPAWGAPLSRDASPHPLIAQSTEIATGTHLDFEKRRLQRTWIISGQGAAAMISGQQL
jgi:hypothetical protein